ncbi:MAG: ABC transporter permease [Acidobacteriota bacterium]|jgi:putative ABC transport system permease protein
MRRFLADLRFAFRALRAQPLFSGVVVLTLILGITVNLAVFCVLEPVLLRQLDYSEPDRLVTLWTSSAQTGGHRSPVSLPDLFDWRDQGESFAGMAAFNEWSFSVAGDFRPERLDGGMVERGLFQVLGVEPILGRGFPESLGEAGADRVVILGHGFWQRRFGGARDVLERSIIVEGEERQVIGVMPPGFEFPDGAELWVPMDFTRNSFPRDLRFVRVAARLAGGVGLDEARTELKAIAARLADEYPESNRGRSTAVVSLHEHLVGSVRQPLLFVQAAALLVLLIACVNISNLLAVRAWSRGGEVAVRRALGAGGGSLARLFFAEGLVLSFVGTGLGLVLATALGSILPRLLPPDALPGFERAASGGTLLGVAAGLGLSVAIICGTVSLLCSHRRALAESLCDGGCRNPGTTRLGRRFQGLLVVSEMGLAVVLLVSFFLLVQSLGRLLDVDPGFETDGVLTTDVVLPPADYGPAERTTRFWRELMTRLEARPEVETAGASWSMPLTWISGIRDFRIDGRPDPEPGEELRTSLQPATPGLFAALDVPLIRGRLFDHRDRRETRPVAVINRAMARLYWPGEDPLGQRITVTANFGPIGRLPGEPREVIGIVGTLKRRGLTEEPMPEMYVPQEQTTWRMMGLAVRSTAAPAAVTAAVREEVWALDSHLPVPEVRPLETVVSDSLGSSRFTSHLLGLFAALALVLVAVGIYGVVSYSTSRRAREIGLRIALGADRREVRWMVVRQAGVLVALGLGLGVVAAVPAGRVLKGLLYGIGSMDPLTYVLAIWALTMVAISASYLPARRAGRTDPAKMLRTD